MTWVSNDACGLSENMIQGGLFCIRSPGAVFLDCKVIVDFVVLRVGKNFSYVES
jgi:hypothetical protein